MGGIIKLGGFTLLQQRPLWRARFSQLFQTTEVWGPIWIWEKEGPLDVFNLREIFKALLNIVTHRVCLGFINDIYLSIVLFSSDLSLNLKNNFSISLLFFSKKSEPHDDLIIRWHSLLCGYLMTWMVNVICWSCIFITVSSWESVFRFLI